MSLLRPSSSFGLVVTLFRLAPKEDYPWIYYALGTLLFPNTCVGKNSGFLVKFVVISGRR